MRHIVRPWSAVLSAHPGLAALLLLQLFCIGFFVWDVVADALLLNTGSTFPDSDAFETALVAVLAASMVGTISQIQRLSVRNQTVENQLKAASGAFAELLNNHFNGWELTASEREVALFAIKGLDIAQIAELRQTKSGTIKAQLNAIYRKASVSGRPQLISLFIEELMSEPLG